MSLLGMLPLAAIVFLGVLLVSQELGVHPLGANVLGALGLLDAVGVGLVRVVVRTRVLLLLCCGGSDGGERETKTAKKHKQAVSGPSQIRGERDD